MLHALGRIISQQTGLRLTRVVTMSGTEFGPLIWNNAEAQWMRMMFIVEVAELTATSSPLVADWSGNYAFGEQHSYGVHGVSGPNSVDVDAVKVILNPVYHGQHVWSNEEDLKEFIDSGLYPTEERSQYQLMMEAFSMYKQDFHNSTR